MSPEVVIVSVIVGAPIAYVSHVWWRARRKSRRLTAVYDRYSTEPVTVVAHAVTLPKRPQPKAWVGWQSRSPTRMNLPAVVPDHRESFDSPLAMPLSTDDAPARFEGQGGKFGGGGSSGSWDPPSASSSPDDPSPSSSDGGSAA